MSAEHRGKVAGVEVNFIPRQEEDVYDLEVGSDRYEDVRIIKSKITAEEATASDQQAVASDQEAVSQRDENMRLLKSMLGVDVAAKVGKNQLFLFIDSPQAFIAYLDNATRASFKGQLVVHEGMRQRISELPDEDRKKHLEQVLQDALMTAQRVQATRSAIISNARYYQVEMGLTNE